MLAFIVTPKSFSFTVLLRIDPPIYSSCQYFQDLCADIYIYVCTTYVSKGKTIAIWARSRRRVDSDVATAPTAFQRLNAHSCNLYTSVAVCSGWSC